MVSQFRIDLYMNPLNFKVPQRAKNPVQRIHRMVSAPRVGSWWTAAFVHPQPTQAALLLAGGRRFHGGKSLVWLKLGFFIIFILFYSPHTLFHTHAHTPFRRRAHAGRGEGGVRGGVRGRVRRSPAAGQPRPLLVPGGPAPSAGHPPQRHGGVDAGSSPGSAAPRGSPALRECSQRKPN